MKIACKKKGYDKLHNQSIKRGLNELRSDWNDEITIRGSRTALTLFVHDEYQKNRIMAVIDNYAIPYQITD